MILLVDLLEHLVASVAVLDHAERLSVLAALVRRGFGHRLGPFTVSLVRLSGLARLSCSQLILSHQRVELLRQDGCVVQLVAVWLLHRLKVVRSVVHLAQVYRLVAALWGHTAGDR